MNSPFPSEIHQIGLVAPAGPARPELLDAGIEQLRQWNLKVIEGAHVRTGTAEKYLSASAAERAADLQQLWEQPEIDLILCVRGGFGSAHLLSLLDWERLRRRPVPVVGYSDITALHLAMIREQAGLPLAGPMAIRMHTIEDYTGEAFRHILSGEGPRRLTLPDGGNRLEVIRAGRVEAPVFAANLAVMATLLGTPWMPDLSGWILLVEDVGEPVYRLDRYLTQLEQSGVLNECAGLIFGRFSDCGEAAEREPLWRRLAANFSGPVLNGFPFGHTFPLASLRQGGLLRIEADGSVSY